MPGRKRNVREAKNGRSLQSFDRYGSGPGKELA
jgi:hypothetical protein